MSLTTMTTTLGLAFHMLHVSFESLFDLMKELGLIISDKKPNGSVRKLVQSVNYSPYLACFCMCINVLNQFVLF